MPSNAKLDNGDTESKVTLRREALRVAADKTVLDCYAGEGNMYREVWSEASAYLGIEQRFSRPPGHAAGQCWKGNNSALISKAMAVQTWGVVDLDAYGNPWPLLRQVLKLSKAKRLVVTTTCGIDRAIRTGASDFAAAVAGASTLSYTGVMTRWYDDIIRWALAWALRETGFTVTRARVTIAAHNPQMRYWLLEFDRLQA